MGKALIILNPWAGRGHAGERRHDLDLALERAGVDYDMVMTHTRGGAIEMARQAIERGYNSVVAVGGDGTLNEAVNGIKSAEAAGGRRVPLGIIPLGTGCDFIKALDGFVPNDIYGSVQRIVRGQTRTVDLGLVRVDNTQERWFINALGTGFDAQAAAEALKITRVKGFAVYLLAIIRAMANYRAHPMTVEFDGRWVQRRLLFASIANGRYQAGGFLLTPDAHIDDGYFDACLVDNLRIDEIIRHIPKVLEGTHTKLRQVTMARVRHVAISSSAPIPVATDGEVLSVRARSVTAELIPGAIDIFA